MTKLFSKQFKQLFLKKVYRIKEELRMCFVHDLALADKSPKDLNHQVT